MTIKNLIELPEFVFELPSDPKKKIRYRPFVTKERKILLMALEGNDENEIMNAINQIIAGCVIEPKDFVVEDMVGFDLETFFLRLRAKSVGEVQALSFTCKNPVDGKECNMPISVDLNLMEINPEFVDHHSPIIMFTDKVGLRMKYPTLKSLKVSKSDEFTAALSYVADCIDYVFDSDNIYYAKDMVENELVEFLENLTDQNFAKIEKFLESIPVLKKTIDIDCPRCKFHHTIVLEGLQSFFD